MAASSGKSIAGLIDGLEGRLGESWRG